MILVGEEGGPWLSIPHVHAMGLAKDVGPFEPRIGKEECRSDHVIDMPVPWSVWNCLICGSCVLFGVESSLNSWIWASTGGS